MIKRLLAIISLLMFLAMPISTASAFSTLQQACSQNSDAQNSSVCGSDSSPNPIYGPNSVLDKIINLVSVIIGIVAVFAIIVAGFMFVTSGGDSARVSTARNTILYVVIGLVVVGIAQLVEIFVINNITPH